jgi:glucose/arabinose dehydrogenase
MAAGDRAMIAPVPAQGPLEAEFYQVDYLKAPEGAVLEVGGMGFLPDGRLAVSTRRGQVWIVEHPLAKDPAEAKVSLFAEGLQEGLGLAVVDGAIVVVQRGELSRLVDADHDGTCDRVETISNGWGLSGHYHEFAYGLPVDAQKNYFVSLNVSFGDPQWWLGRSTVPWRGWIVEIAPDGKITPFASGFRSPCGLGLSPEGDLFETDNQGDWMPVCPIYHVKKGGFYGHPASLAWTDEYQKSGAKPSDTVPPDHAREPAAIWLPYKWSRSAGNLVWDGTGGKFGPFAGQTFVAELTNGMVVRAQMEKVRGEWQGACFLFRQRIGSVARVAFASDGTLFCGFTNRGWGGLAPAEGIARVRWTGKTPFEMKSVHLLQDGFDVEFTKAVSVSAAFPGAEARLYHYDWWWEYGSPERGTEKLALESSAISADPRHLILHFKGLRAGEVARVTLPHVLSEDGEPLLHDEFDYTINQLSDGPRCDVPIARVVPPPPARESDAEGWLRLCYGDAFDQWNAKGWKLCDAELDPTDATKLVTKEGMSALVDDGPGAPGDFASKLVFGDATVHVAFRLPEKGGGALRLMNRYEIRLSADAHCGALAPSAHSPGREPALDAWKGPGVEHELDVVFRAPRFDAQGKKTENARFEKVILDDVLLHESVELSEPSEGAPADEVPGSIGGPLVFRGDRGAIAMGGIKVKPGRAPAKETGWTPLFDGEDLAGFTQTGDASWSVDDGTIVGTGKPGRLVSTRTDYRDVEVRARIKIGDGGRSAILVRGGYEARVNSSHPDPERTGSLAGLAPVKVALVGPDTWFDLQASCVDEPGGTRVRIRVNGVLVTDILDDKRRFASGPIALEQHHEGSRVEIRSIEVRELSR